MSKEEIVLKKIPFDQAKKLIYLYVRNHPGCLTSDIIADLELDPDLVLEVLSYLKHEGVIEGKPVEDPLSETKPKRYYGRRGNVRNC